MGKISSTFLIFTNLLVAELLVCCLGGEGNATFGCISRERDALLRFKASLSDPSNRLSSWNASTDCCNWQGIMCDETSGGHVIRLDLQNQRYEQDNYSMVRSDTLDSSIFDLKHLSFLDLSGNDFHLSSIPSSLGSLNQLQHLNLSCSNFNGVIPHDLGNLSLLSVLDLSGFNHLVVDDFTWVSRLSSLRHLNMSLVDLSQTNDLLKVLNMLPFLIDLRMSESGITNRNLQHACVNSALTHIEYLDLSYNLFDGELPCFLQNMTSLRYLLLTSTNYSSCNQLLHLVKLTSLVQLSLDNSLHQCNADIISEFVLDKPHLKYISLAKSSCDGDVSKIFLKLSVHADRKLEFLDLSSNSFYGHLPQEIGGLTKLQTLNLGENNISGPIPNSIGNLSALKRLYLVDNHLNGEIPISLGQLSNLEVLHLSNNSLDGMISESHFATLSKLRSLSTHNTYVTFGLKSNWIPPFQLEFLDMRSCAIVGGESPKWLETQKDLIVLYMSNCSISGPVPNLPSSMTVVDLSHNSIEGAIPDSICQVESLFHLDLSSNRLSGDLPECWAMLDKLAFLSLSSNSLSGAIPESIGRAYSLQWLQLNDNRFSGELPYSLRNCTWLEGLDIHDNSISGKLPKWIGNYLLNLKVLRLSNNKFFDKIPSNLCQLSQLQILDLANNMLSGNIPACIGNISRMQVYTRPIFLGSTFILRLTGVEQEYFANLKYVVYLDLSNNSLVGEIPVELTRLAALSFLNLSHNHLRGNIPQLIGDMSSLIALDLSNNTLSGNIPESLSDLNFLSHLNLSHNNLEGHIPTGNQLQTLEDVSIYEGNPGLCGTPLPKKCHDDQDKQPKGDPNIEDEDEKAESIWFYGIVASGFATGFWGAIGVLVFKKGWRYVYFKFTDRITTRIFGE